VNEETPYSPPVDPGILRAISDYEGRWMAPGRDDLESEDDYSEDSFA
jgi:hypothetical protein